MISRFPLIYCNNHEDVNSYTIRFCENLPKFDKYPEETLATS